MMSMHTSQVVRGNLQGIKALHCAGAGLERTDNQGRTPLIVACTKSESFQVVKFLISLGADVNAYSPGSRAGTPLHHAAKSGLVHIVELLLSHGVNPSVLNDDCQTALDLARAKGHWRVLRLFELRICHFNCWLREVHKPSILEAIIRQGVSQKMFHKIWAIILPCDSCNPRPLKYELAIYSDFQATHPNSVIPLSSVHIEETTFDKVDPALIIVNKITKKQYTFRSENKGDKQQLQLLYNFCKGISQQKNHFQSAPPLPAMPVASLHNLDNPAKSDPEDVGLSIAINASIQSTLAEVVPVNDIRPVVGPNNFSSCGTSSETATRPAFSASVDVELAMAINASIQSAIAEGVHVNDIRPVVGPSNFSSCGTSSETPTRLAVSASVQVPPPTASIPSAPPKAEELFYGGSIHYPSTDSSPVDFGHNSNSSFFGTSSETATQLAVRASVQVPHPTASIPSAPPKAEELFYGGPIHYPSIDSSPVDFAAIGSEGSSISCLIDLTTPSPEMKTRAGEAKEVSSISGLCVICLDVPAEGACIPCGHVAGCMSCLMEIRTKKMGCPVCRAKIDQVIKLYAV